MTPPRCPGAGAGRRVGRPEGIDRPHTAAPSSRAATAGDRALSAAAVADEVVRLVIDPRTNTQIATELFLSVKTVESHLRSVFRKLGVSSRVEVARMIERLE